MKTECKHCFNIFSIVLEKMIDEKTIENESIIESISRINLYRYDRKLLKFRDTNERDLTLLSIRFELLEQKIR